MFLNETPSQWVLRRVYKQPLQGSQLWERSKSSGGFRVNACIDSTKGKNKLRNYCTELVGLYTQRKV